MVFIIITLVVALITGIVTTFMNELVLGGLYDINSGLAMRAIYIFLKLTHESDEAPQYKKRLKNTVVFAVIAQLPFIIESIIVSYLT